MIFKDDLATINRGSRGKKTYRDRVVTTTLLHFLSITTRTITKKDNMKQLDSKV